MSKRDDDFNTWAAPALDARIRELEADLARVTAERDRYSDYATEMAVAKGAVMDERDALAAKLARCEELLRDIANGRVGAGGALAYFAEQEPRAATPRAGECANCGTLLPFNRVGVFCSRACAAWWKEPRT